MSMIRACERSEDCWTNIVSLDFVLCQRLRGYSETQRHVLSGFQGLKKTICRICGSTHRSYYDKKVRRIRDKSCGDVRIYLEVEVRRVYCRKCKKVKREELDWIATNPFYTKRFAHYVGRKCRSMTIQDVAKELKLDWHTVKSLDKEYMQKQLQKYPVAAPRCIGIDEISIKKGHSYRIVVSDLERRRPIWFGGKDRSEESLNEFYQWLGIKKSRRYSWL